MTQYSSFPLGATRDIATGANGKTVHNASYLAARHTSSASSKERLVPAAGSVSSALPLTAALGDITAHDRGYTSLQLWIFILSFCVASLRSSKTEWFRIRLCECTLYTQCKFEVSRCAEKLKRRLFRQFESTIKNIHYLHFENFNSVLFIKFCVLRTVNFGIKLYNDQLNAQVFNLFYLSIYVCLTCLGLSFGPSSEADLNHCRNCTPASEDGPKRARNI
jgi:hypothetical protein